MWFKAAQARERRDPLRHQRDPPRPGRAAAASPAWACAMATGFREIGARAVVLGCGGFEANPEWRARYLGRPWDHAKVRGTRYNTGDGLRMALEIGALPCGQWTGCHSTPDRRRGAAPRRSQADRQDQSPVLSVRRAGGRATAGGSSTRARTSSSTRTPSWAASSSTSPAASPTRSSTTRSRACSRGATRPGRPAVGRHARRAGGRSCRSIARALPARRSRRTTPRWGRAPSIRPCATGSATRGLGAAEVELGAAPRHAALHRVAGHRRHHLHVRRRAGERAGAGAEHELDADPRALRVRRDGGRAVPRQLSGRHRADVGRRLRPDRRAPARRGA